MAISVIAMLLAGCLTDQQARPDRTIATATLRSPQPTPPSLQTPALASPTSQELVRPAPTHTSTPTIIPTGQIPLPNDLLFLSGNRLMRWSHAQNNARPVVIDAAAYSVSQDGSKVAVLRNTGITANAIETFDLTVLDTRNGDFVKLLDATPRLLAFQISPDGRWVALMNELHQLYILPSNGSKAGAKIAECQSKQAGECTELAWSMDSQELIWEDTSGIWRSSPDRPSPNLAISNQLDIADPKGQLTRKQVQFHDLDWSPFGRYILTRIQPIGSDVSWQAIIDTRLKRVAEIPASYQVNKPNALSFWLSNGDLLVIHPATRQQNQPLTLESWQILPTREDLMSLNLRWEISSNLLDGSNDGKSWSNLPSTARQVNERTLAMAINSTRLDGPGKLFTFDLKYGILNKIADLPSQVVSVSWTPDGKAALVTGSDGALIYITADGNNISDVTAHFGRQACCYTWLADETTLR